MNTTAAPMHGLSQADALVQPWAALDWLATLAVVMDEHGCVVFANAAFEAAVGVSRRMLQGSEFASLLTTPDLLRQGLEQHSGQAPAYAALSFDTGLLRLGREPLEVQLSLSRIEETNWMLVELYGLEQQARQEREMRWAEQAEANKQLVRNLAHEIKNPLGGIRGAAQLLEMDMAPEQTEQRECTQVIIREADRLQRLVDRLLEPHRQPHQLEPLNIHEVCEHVRALVLMEYPQAVSIERDYDISIPELLGDRTQLTQALLNMVQNAAQALAEQRPPVAAALITLRTRVVRQATLGRKRHRLAVELQVIDNGPGVPASIKERIFYPLVTGRPAGTGLGLSLAQTFIQRHQGVIECESMPEHTVFRILLPLL